MLGRRESDGDPPEVAVVIPAYKQPEYLKEAVLSALHQSMVERTKIVIVNDGCPYASTDAVGKYFRSAFSDRVCYLRKRNGGVASARNYGIRFALSAWPSVRAVFPLDADNRLSKETLTILCRALRDSDEDVGWIYQDQTRFGADNHTWKVGLRFSGYRLMFENFCDAGSLVDRRLFDSGIWYDESLRAVQQGYEDWEFFIHATLRGFRGVYASDTGFLYRLSEHSMLAEAQAEREAVHRVIRTKHPQAFHPSFLTHLEHAEMPRFALAALDSEEVRYATDVSNLSLPASLREFLGGAASWSIRPDVQQHYVPPITVFSDSGVFAGLEELKLLPGLLYLLQHRLAESPHASMILEPASSSHDLRLGTSDSKEPSVVAVSLQGLRRLLGGAGDSSYRRLERLRTCEPRPLVLEVGAAYAACQGHFGGPEPGTEGVTPVHPRIASVAAEHSLAAPQEPGPALAGKDRILGPHSLFAVHRHLEQRETTFPFGRIPRPPAAPPTEVVFATPWIRLGGVDQIVLNLAKALDDSVPRCRAHLVVTEVNAIEARPRALDPFETVTFLAQGVTSDDAALLSLLSTADMVINAHSAAGYRVLPELKRRSSPTFVSMLQVIDFDQDGRPNGYPLVAARDHQNLIDYFVTPSEQLKRSLRAFGVPEEKIRVVPNAPSVRPRTTPAALEIAARKSRRRFSSTEPVRILFSGRFDVQKGFDRLPAIVSHLAAARIPYELRVVGKPLLSQAGDLPDLPATTYLPAAVDPTDLAEEYEEADVFLLPSRWEGLPLSALEAMSFGAVTVSTNVGAIAEVVQHRRNGILISPQLADEDIAREVAEWVYAIVGAAETYSELRRCAVRTAMGMTWEQAAAQLIPLVPEARGPS